MLLKYFPLVLLLAQCIQAAPTSNGATTANPNDPTQNELEQEAHNETIKLLNALFRAQIAYFSGVRVKLSSSSQRARDIELYVSRLREAITETDLDKKNEMWLKIFEQFSKSPLLLNKPEETGLSNDEYQALLTDSKLQEIAQSFIQDVSTYFWKMAQISGKVVELGVDDYFNHRSMQHQ
ncbi:uncharacterized protein LOC117780175 [Drosophila innubila]|uniref:uncharacterized protein LOC117780175 n=1 Tax=Drosophila innubila TaxID=198719 RepID=UPI00148C583D|nr:uncharacterized protein LOC117780175 [Drosophila innubila]